MSGLPGVARLAAPPVAAVFSGLARLRSGPAIHAVGTSYAARLEVAGAESSGRRLGLQLFDDAGRHEALVRLSRGAGFPTVLPDVLGLAIRLDAGQGSTQDLLLDSCWPGPVGRHLVRPGRSTTRGWYGSLLAYDAGDGAIHLAARGERPEQLVAHDTAVGQAFTLLAARPYSSDWHAWARLTLLEPVTRPELRFSPAHDGHGVRLRLDAVRFRVPSYRASQRQGPFDRLPLDT